MKSLLTVFLSSAALAAVFSVTPAAAQVAGNPGDLHTPTPYTESVDSPYRGGAPYGYGPYAGPFGPLGAVAAGVGAFGAGVANAAGAVVGAPAASPVYAAQPGVGCRVHQDFNGRYTSVCSP